MSGVTSGPHTSRPPSEARRSFPELLSYRARNDRLGPAMFDEQGDALSFGDWDARTNRVAASLQDRGVSPGLRVGLLFDNARPADGAVAYTAIMRAGGVVVALPAASTERELQAVVQRADVGCILYGGAVTKPAASVAVTVPELDQGHTRFRPVPVAPQALAEIIFTSGTTGVPKGVAVTHANMALGSAIAPMTEPARGGHIHALAPGTNIGQLAMALPLMFGAPTVVMRRFDPLRFCELVQQHRVGRATLVPTMALWLLANVAPGQYDLSSLSLLTLSTAPAPPSVLPRLAGLFPNAVVRNAYGSTESWPAATTMELGRDPQESVGRPPPGVTVAVVDEAGRPVPPGEAGEVVLHAPGVPRRWYWNDPDATRAVFNDAGTRMGDAGYLDDAGYLFLLDRIRDVINVGGLNVSSTEVESALLRHPTVRAAAAVGLPDDILGHHVGAAVVLTEPTSAADIRRFVASILSPHKVPLVIRAYDELPRSQAGKVVKATLRDELSAPGPTVSERHPGG